MNKRKPVLTAYVEPEVKEKLKRIKDLWKCTESAAIKRLILEKKGI